MCVWDGGLSCEWIGAFFVCSDKLIALCFGMGNGSNVENNSEAVMELLLVIITDEIGSYPPALLCLALSLLLILLHTYVYMCNTMRGE